MKKLIKHRTAIDEIDRQLVSLLQKRMDVVTEIGKLKRQKRAKIYQAQREKRIVAQLLQQVDHPVLKEKLPGLYNDIFTLSRITQALSHKVKPPFTKIAVIGLGLLGGSLCKAIKLQNPAIKIVSIKREDSDSRSARESGLVDHEYRSFKVLLRHVDLIILASPLSTITEVAQKITKAAQKREKKLIVMDVASVKAKINQYFQQNSNSKLEFVSTHPMAGKEKSGISNSEATLFVHRPWIIVPHDQNCKHTISKIKSLISLVGGVPRTLAPQNHDKKVALISHLPALLSKAYLDFILDHDKSSIKFAGPGFQSFTRLAHDNPAMQFEIKRYNKNYIQKYLNLWIRYMRKGREL
ncbi:MAG: prephenate dehydrogenase/arogenate dehydrogenase family protein [Oligoflexia bacterium]|nr:prephenate dehydrogenase/arogenate dehydrogenase family protein [Oligoflexia bacterium]